MRFVYILVFMALFSTTLAQSVTVSGIVSDETGEGLPGVTVSIKEVPGKGAITDIMGSFSLSVETGQTLVISYIGFISQEFQVSTAENLSIVLKTDVETLEEIVVIGYGVQKKSDVTGATGVLTAKDVALQPLQRVENMLQGRVAGVVVSQNSGAPGSSPQVNIRGFTGNPTYVIDGFIDADINAINPNDIESISVLKDASATAIYGSRGANGVILITTKKADKSSPFKVSAEYYHTISQLNKKLDLLNPLLYMQIVNQKLDEAGASEVFSREEIDEARNPGFGTDWQDVVFQTAHSNNLDLNLSKGWEKITARVSLGARDDQGIVDNSNYRRYTSRLNLRYTPFPNTTVSAIGGYTTEQLNNINRSSANNAAVAAATAWSPNLPIIDPATDDYTIFQGYGATVRRNPAYIINEIDGVSNNSIWNGSISLSHKFLNDFTAIATYSMQKRTGDANSFRRFEQGNTTRLAFTDSENTRNQWNLQVNYQKEIKDHSVNASVVAEVLDRESDTFRFDNIYNADETPGETVPDPQDPYDFTELGQISYLSRVNYGYKDKLLFTGSVRLDASSRLPESNQWDEFFSGAVAYRISDEAFLASSEWIQELKLRVGYGEVGNVNSIGHTQIQNLT
ncbi:MAG: SusC/RagA family TonB-linked outer membrane protein, partial [Ekhidna sp.]|nr:SusC/RagA family TonB-linked outer membrane protein [Ekhidna sp.]